MRRKISSVNTPNHSLENLEFTFHRGFMTKKKGIIDEKEKNHEIKLVKALRLIDERIRKLDKLVVELKSSFLAHEKFLEKIEKSNENMDETLANVLLAIKQNEYLQAWYPKQSGFPEMKVVGKHPLKLMQEKN